MRPPRSLRPMLLLVAACSGARAPTAAPSPEPIAETCATRLSPRAPDVATSTGAATGGGIAPPFVAPRSTIVVQVEVPLAGIRQSLEAKVPRRIAEERDHDLGVAGRLEYTVDRGPFTARVENATLVVESDLHGRAQACAKGRCYAGCAPEARVTAKVPLHIGVDYRLRSSEVRVDVTKPCEVRALGGLLTLDVTPVLRGALAQQARSVQASIDRELPDFSGEAARLWTDLAQTRELPLGMCIALAPEEITQGPAGGSAEVARLRFGLLARPELRVRCAGAVTTPPPSKVPPLRDDPALPSAGDVHLAIVLLPDAPARALERGADVIDLGGRRARIARASGDVAQGLVLELGGEVCGEVGMTPAGLAWNDAQSLHLTRATAAAGDVDRLTAAQLDASRIAAAVEHAPIALPIAVSAFEGSLPEVARGMSNDQVTVTASVEIARPDAAGFRGAEPIATVLLRGGATLRVK